jgi:hypothetical protein
MIAGRALWREKLLRKDESSELPAAFREKLPFIK